MGSSSSEGGLDSVILDQFNNPESRGLLDTIDSLRELQVGEIISLPQIVVVGDQSSGKSSVLEAISRVHFPVDGELCTRFATELVLRRATEPRVDVRIQYANRAANPGGGLQQPFQKSAFDNDALPEIIAEAKERMDIRKGGKKGFSKDILRVEISGPGVYPVTLVDLPGFFHSETAEQSPEDKETVDRLAESYMKQEKSVILAVVAANNNLANQVVVEKAREHDPARERTLGVITKPDLAGSGPNGRKYIDLAKGLEASQKLTLGWFVLRNRSEDEKDAGFTERDLSEQRFFESGEWSSVLPSNRGVESLRRKLSKVLLDHIKTSLPGLIHEIDANLSVRKEALKRLGKPRSGPDEQRFYLLDIAEAYQRLARDAVDGRYSDPFFGDLYQDSRKLRALVRKLNGAFDATVLMKGGTYDIQWDDNADNGNAQSLSVPDDFSEYLRPFIEMYKGFPGPEPITQSSLNLKVEMLAASNQGKELPGTPNSGLALQFFKMQARPWRDIARFYMDRVLDFSKAFAEQLIEHIVGPDEATTMALLRSCVDPFFDQKRDLLEEKLQELLRPYTSGYGLPLETQFHSRLSGTTLNRLANQLTELLEEEHPDLFENQPRTKLSRKLITDTILDAEEFRDNNFGTERIIDMMVANYEVN